MQVSNEKSADEQVSEAMSDALAGLSEGRLAALEEMRTLHVLGTAMMIREKQRLERKLGTQHPLVGRLQEGIARNAEVARSLRAQIEVAKIRVPEVNGDVALIHGRVADESGRGIAGVAVCYETVKEKNRCSWTRSRRIGSAISPSRSRGKASRG